MKLFVLIILNLHYTLQSPLIFGEGEYIQTCTHPMKLRKKVKNLEMPSYIDVGNTDLNIILSFCEKKRKEFTNNQICSGTCLYDKKTQILQSLHNKTSYRIDDNNNDEIVLNILNEFKCGVDKNYEIIVKMVSSPSLKKPTLYMKDECELEIQILKPDYTPPCTYLLDKRHLIDLRPLKGKSISTPFKGGKFNIAVCGAATNFCESDEAACFTGNESFAIGTTKTQMVRYDSNDNEINVIASVKDGGKKNLEVKMKCNWTVPYLENLKYVEPPKKGRNYKFEVETSFACIKLPFSCVYKDKENHLSYDLRKLYKKDGYRIHTSTGNIILNICGSLTLGKGTKGNDCDKSHSQICEVDNGVYKNKGSIPLHEIVDGKFVRLKFIEGSVCNLTEKYVTNIDFKCSTTEEGPVISSKENCTMNLLWKTPKACPNVEITSESCTLQTDLNPIDFSSLYSNEDNDQILSNNKERLLFNICGNLHSNCSDEKGVAACLKRNKGDDIIIGYNQPKLSYSNGKLSLRYEGEKCEGSEKTSSLTINMICASSDLKIGKVYVGDAPCTYLLDVSTKKACIYGKIVDCTVQDEAAKYNLTALVAVEKNYKVRDDVDKNLVYLLNVCAPLVNEQGTILLGNAMVAKMNRSEPHIFERFTSLGKVIGPSLINGKLVLNSKLGFSCKENLGADYNSKIVFECSDKEKLPILVKKESCSYEFLWKTKHACPDKKPKGSCVLDIGENKVNIPSDGIKLILDRKDVAYYTLHPCFDEYEIFKGGSSIKRKLFDKSPEIVDGAITVRLQLKNKNSRCTNDDPVNRVNMKMVCDEEQQNISVSLENDNLENCEISVLVKTKKVCENDSIPHRNVRITKTEESELKTDSTSILSEIMKFGEKVKNKTNIFDSPIEKYDVVKSEENNASTTKTTVQNMTHNIIPKETQKQNIVQEKIEEKEKLVQKDTKDEVILEKSCSNLNDIGFNLKELKTTEIKSEKSRYILNFDGSSQKCGGSICKNGVSLLNFLEFCPASVEKKESFIRIEYKVPACHHIDVINSTKTSTDDSFHIQLILECKESSDFSYSVEESLCQVKFHGNLPHICNYSSIEKKSSFSIVWLMIIMALLILVLTSIVWFSIRSNWLKKCSYSPVGNMRESESMIHFKIP